jgi:hypothetical protein
VAEIGSEGVDKRIERELRRIEREFRSKMKIAVGLTYKKFCICAIFPICFLKSLS